MTKTIIRIESDSALTVEFGNQISEDINRRVHAFCEILESHRIKGITDVIPAYCTVMICYDPCVILCDEVVRECERALEGVDWFEMPSPTVIDVPVLYGGKYGPDLLNVAEHNNLTCREVVRIHSQPEYLIYMMGFTVGFVYLGGLDERIHTPRLSTPRILIPGGSVGIANNQTGIYPLDSPGGWQLIGHTPIRLYDPERSAPIKFQSGQHIKFRSITEDEYKDILAKESSSKGLPIG